jgi:hypothetical protein
MQNAQMTADERAVMWERRARSQAKRADALLDLLVKIADLTGGGDVHLIDQQLGLDDRRLCESMGHADRIGWPEDGFRTYQTEDGGTISWCPECVASWPAETNES